MREHYDIGAAERTEEETAALRQVSVDVPRTAPGVAFFHQTPVQHSLERILYLWGIRWVTAAILVHPINVPFDLNSQPHVAHASFPKQSNMCVYLVISPISAPY